MLILSAKKKTVSGSIVSFSDAKSGEAFKAVIADIDVSGGATGVTVNRVGANLLKLKNGEYSITARKLTVSDGAVKSEYTSGSSASAVLVSSGAFYSSYKIPAGTYYFDIGYVSGKTFHVPFVRFSGVNGQTYDLGSGGTITLPVAASINSIRDSVSNTFSSSASDYVIKPKITLISSQAWEAWSGDAYTVSWSSQAGSVTDGEINLTTGVLTSGGNTYQLTPTAITAKSGVNTVWADTGDVSVTYIAE